jgi:hypothetical protein
MIAYAGEVRCVSGGAAVNLSLHGRSRAAGPVQASCDTDILFSGANAPSLPDILHEVRVIELDSAVGASRRFRIESRELPAQFEARGAQLHRFAGAAMFTAVPAPHVPWHVRAGFSLLVSVLGIPGLGSLILRRRGAP